MDESLVVHGRYPWLAQCVAAVRMYRCIIRERLSMVDQKTVHVRIVKNERRQANGGAIKATKTTSSKSWYDPKCSVAQIVLLGYKQNSLSDIQYGSLPSS